MMNHAVCKNRVSLMHPWSEKEMKKLDHQSKTSKFPFYIIDDVETWIHLYYINHVLL